MTRKKQVRTVIFDTVKKQKGLSLGIVSAVIGAVVFALIPPLILADIVDSITAGTDAAFARILLYFAMLALTGFTESARESLLVVFGQKITHALRSSLMDKFTHLTADNMTKQEPGTLVSRFVGDVDTVETLFSSGIISMFADACRIISILVVIRFQNRGLAIVLLVLLPFLFCFTRHVQKNMLAAQIENRKAVGRASGHVPETLHNIRTIHCLGKEKYMEKRYDTYINESYRAMEKTNFYDAVYSPIILITNAVVVAVVMLLSASGNTTVLTLFGMSAGTAVAVINYISQIFTPVESLGMEIQTIQSALAGIHRINEFFALEENPDTVPTHEPKTITARSGSVPFVEFRNVTFGYDTRVVLDHLSFKVMDGDQVTLTGRTAPARVPSSSFCSVFISRRAARCSFTACRRPISAMMNAAVYSAAWSRRSTWCRARCATRSRYMTAQSATKPCTLRRSSPGSRIRLKAWKKATTRVVPMICSRRANGSFCPSQELQQPHRACCCSMRSLQTLTPRPNAPCFPL